LNANKASLLLWDVYGRLRSATNPQLTSVRDVRLAAHDPVPSPPLEARFFRRYLENDLIPFWRRSIDHEHGGFVVHLDRSGKRYGRGDKRLAIQARMVFAFSAAFHLSNDDRDRSAADGGLDFLIERMEDRDRGGWFAMTTRDGALLDGSKKTFDHGYLLIGLAEHHLATADPRSRELALETLDYVRNHLWDRRLGGYFESAYVDGSISSRRKTLCCQLDMLSGLILLHEATRDESVLSYVEEQADNLVNFVLDKRGGLVEVCRPDWRYEPRVGNDSLVTGHTIKGAWLLSLASRLFGPLDRERYLEAARRCLEFAWAKGWDRRNGGFHSELFRCGMPARSLRMWWPHADALPALALMYQLTGEQDFRTRLEELLRYCWQHFVDPIHGEWYTSFQPGGSKLDSNKGAEWKAAFHTVHAAYHLTQILESLEASSTAGSGTPASALDRPLQ
jgi:mannose 2-epimerase